MSKRRIGQLSARLLTASALGSACLAPSEEGISASILAAEAVPMVVTQHGIFDLRVEDLGASDRGLAAGDPTSILVQFDGPVQPEWVDVLGVLGAQLVAYVPEHAVLLHAPLSLLGELSSLPHVTGTAIRPPAFKLDPHLDQKAPGDGPAWYRVGLRAGASAAELDAIAKVVAHPIERVAPLENRFTGGEILDLNLAPDDLAQLARLEAVDFIEPKRPLVLFNDTSHWTVQAGPTSTGQTPVWDRGLRGEGQVVAFADTGLHQASCFFAGDKIAGYDDWSTPDGDRDGHGTHVGGSIAGDRFANGRADSGDGMAPASLLFVQDVAQGGQLGGIPSDLGRLFQRAHAAGARIHSDSWGAETSAYDAIARSLDRFVANHPDFLVLVANGNSGPRERSVGAPATAKNVLSIGASENGARADRLASFSSRGPTDDGRLKPTLTAPGVRIVSARTEQSCATVALSGTSMATPTAAGAASLVRQYFSEGFYPSGRRTAADAFEPSAALLKATLIAGAREMASQSILDSGQGFGRIQLDDSLYFEGDDRRLLAVEGTPLTQGTTARIRFETDQTGPLKVVLVWTDPPGAAFSGRALVNDLNLSVVAPNESYLGNVLQSDRSVPGGTADSVNVEELVYLPNAPAGVYEATVSARDVPTGQQDYALVVVGALGTESAPPPPPSGPDPDPDQVEVVTESSRVGWVVEGEAGHHLGDDDIYAGENQGREYLGIVQFPIRLPADQVARHAELEMVVQTTQFTNGGSFRLDVIDLDNLTGLQYERLTAAASLGDVPPALVGADRRAGERLRFVIPTELIKNGRLTLRVRGDGTGDSVLSFDSGFGTGGLGIPPKLHIDLGPSGAPPAEDARELSPTSEGVAWLTSEGTKSIGDDDLYAGQFNGREYLAVVQIPLPQDEAWRSGELRLVGQTTQYINGGNFKATAIALGPIQDASLSELTGARAIADLSPLIEASALGRGETNTLTIPAAVFTEGLEWLTIVLRGDAPGSVMSWDSGHGTGGLGLAPSFTLRP